MSENKTLFVSLSIEDNDKIIDIEKRVLEDIGEVIYTKINYDLLHEMIEPIVEDIVEKHISVHVDFEKYSLGTIVEEDDVDVKVLDIVVREVLLEIGRNISKKYSQREIG